MLLGGKDVKPYKTTPALVERIWGGNRLNRYNKASDRSAIGESWETGAIEQGTGILVKLIDASDILSVQVHPDDEFAQRIENARNGKDEAWVILECDEDSFIIYGFCRPIQKEELRNRLKDESVTEILNYVRVKKGDCIFIPAGTVHSLGKGILAYEVQQPSDLTYRLYDWGRTDNSGMPRELHIDKALEAIDYTVQLPEIKNIYASSTEELSNILNCEYFKLSYKFLGHKERQIHEGGCLKVVTTVSGSIAFRFEDSLLLCRKGDTCIIPEDYTGIVSIKGIEDSEYIIATKQE